LVGSELSGGRSNPILVFRGSRHGMKTPSTLSHLCATAVILTEF
jgi:hypothetical protein